jgi:glucose-1-phosphate cytidylyltransferase
MKVVLFCGGQGTRMREYSEAVPKPMVPIGYRPILWHVMKYYAHYGVKDFILCLGYRGDVIKNYFRNYDEGVSNDFVLSQGGRQVEMLKSDIDDWRITFCDTGQHSNIGQRLRAVKKHLQGEDVFLANYADGLTDLPLPVVTDFFQKSGKTACFVGVRPAASFHLVSIGDGGGVRSIEHIQHTETRINGGFFVLKKEIFDYMQDGEELVVEPFRRLIEAGQLAAYSYDGFWACMDTFKEKQQLDDLFAQGKAPWEVWRDQA